MSINTNKDFLAAISNKLIYIQTFLGSEVSQCLVTRMPEKRALQLSAQRYEAAPRGALIITAIREIYG